MKEAIHKGTSIIQFYLYEKSRISQSFGEKKSIESRLVVVRDWGMERRIGVTANGYSISLGVMKRLHN